MMMMRPLFATTASLRLLLFGLYVSGTSAVSCEVSYYAAAISSQAELETAFAGCTEIEGNINIAANYTGRFYLTNVTTISGSIRTPTEGYVPIPVPLLTSIQAPSLNDTQSIDINGVPALTYIWFPRLTVVTYDIRLVGIEEGCIVDFPALTTTGGLVVSGNTTDLSFPLLAYGGTMQITAIPLTSRDQSEYLLVDRVDHPPFDISFPELQNASEIYLQGNIRSLNMPQLSTIKRKSQEYYQHLRIRTHGHPLNISLPNLSKVNYISVAGTIGSISFPSLNSLQEFEVNTSTPLNVTLEPIKTISGTLRLFGNITEVSMSSIDEFYSITVESDSDDFYCSSIASDFERIKSSKLKDYNCSGRVKSKRPLILGLSIGLGVSTFLALVGYVIWRCWRKRKLTEVKHDTPPEYELGLPPTYTADGLPSYIASEGEWESEQGAGDVAGARTGDASSVREEGASEHSAGDAASARPVDGSSAHQEGASGRRAV